MSTIYVKNPTTCSGSGTSSGSQTPRKKETAVEIYERELDRIEERKPQLIKIIKELKKFPYKIGDIVVHPKFGNCIVHDIRCKSQLEYERLGHSLDISKADGPSVFIQAGGQDYPHWTSLDEIMPHNKTSKVLYGKK